MGENAIATAVGIAIADTAVTVADITATDTAAAEMAATAFTIAGSVAVSCG